MVVPKSNIANTHTFKKRISPNFENTTARPDDTALSIQRGCPPSRASTESSHSSSPSLMDDSLPSDCDYAERVAVQNNMDIVDNNAPHPLAPGSTTSPCCPRKCHVPPMRTCLTNSPLLTTPIRPWNSPHPRSFPTVLTFQLTLTCGTEISQLPLCLAQTNFYRTMSATWPAHYNAWYASSNSEVWKDATATTSPNWNYLANQPGSSYLQSSNLAGTNFIHPKTPLSTITSLLMLEICKLMIGPLRTTPLPKRQWKGKLHHPSHPAPPKNKWKTRRNIRKHARLRVKALHISLCPMPRPPMLRSAS